MNESYQYYYDRNSSNTNQLEPPAKFAFLSGIHPDLDQELCDIDYRQQFDNSKKKISPLTINTLTESDDSDTVQSSLQPQMFLNNEPSSRQNSSQHHKQNPRCPSLGKTGIAESEHGNYKSPWEMHQSENNRPSHDTIEEPFQRASHKSRRKPPVHYETKSDFRFDSSMVASEPTEIIYRMPELNESIESIPFSMDGMERAKKTIQDQAAKIRALETLLGKMTFEQNSAKASQGVLDEDYERKVSTPVKTSSSTSNQEKIITDPSSLRKIMTPEERLKAHRERKRKENKYREESGKWGKPPPLETQSLSSKVSRRDDFVDRLAADPTHRRQYDEVAKNVKRTMKGYSHLTENDKLSNDPKSWSSESYGEVTKSKSVEKMSNNKQKTKNKIEQQHVKENLTERLNMSNREQRPSNYSEKYSEEQVLGVSQKGRNNFVSNDQNDEINSINDQIKHRCQTCNVVGKCEEDIDNPGVFYCFRCWDEYERNGGDPESSSSRQGRNEQSYVTSARKPSTHDSVLLEPDSNDEALWIIHDNPKLGMQVISSGPKKMNCMVETKDPTRKNVMRVLLGTIDFCGKVEESGIGGKAVNETDLGAECLRLGNILGYVVDFNTVKTRLSATKSVYEFRLNDADAFRLTGVYPSMTLKQFFAGCTSAVDVILDPQCTPDGWYPNREADSDSRKIAPQFRSKGIGYIRLGDDMGRNGLAFLSSDHCTTFFSEELLERRDSLNRNQLRAISSLRSIGLDKKKMYNSSSDPLKKDGKRNLSSSKYVRERHQDEDNLDVSSSDTSGDNDDDQSSQSSVDDDDDKVMSPSELLKQLQNTEGSQDLKWNDKADILLRLGKAIKKNPRDSSSSMALNYIQDVIGAKNVNVHVLRSALTATESIGDAMGGELSSHVSWKTIMIESLKLLKNKQVSGIAKEMLRKLHGRCYTLANSLTSISHVLGVGKSSTQNLRRTKSSGTVNSKGTPTSKSSSSDSMKFQKANNVEVIEWLAEITERERSLECITPMIDETSLSLLANFFLSHESHRDAKCRKNALDGLIHSLVYGIDRLGMSIADAQSLCLDLKTSNPRAWVKLGKSVCSILEQELRKSNG